MTEESSTAVDSHTSLRGWAMLASIAATVVMLWGFVFPALTASPRFQQRQAEREEQGIDLAAFFYTDLDSIERRDRLQQMNEAEPWALWCPWRSGSTAE